MFFKIIVIAFLAIGAYAAYEVTDAQRQQFKQMVEQYCKKNGAEGKSDEVENAVKSFIDCAKELIDPDTIKDEIEKAKPNGALDEVFKKYCDKSPRLKTCIHTLASAVAPCVEASVRDHVGDFNNATDQLIDFVCFKDGDRIALFIAEGGPECFQTKMNEIRECANKLQDSVPDVDTAKKLPLQDQCKKVDDLSVCVVKSLETCSTPTPANMAESLFKFVRNGSPCKDIKQ